MSKENCSDCKVLKTYGQCYQQVIDALEKDLGNRAVSIENAVSKEETFFELRKNASALGCQNADIEGLQFRIVANELLRSSIGAS